MLQGLQNRQECQSRAYGSEGEGNQTLKYREEECLNIVKEGGSCKGDSQHRRAHSCQH